MKLLNGKSMLWPPQVAPDWGCHPQPLAAPLPRFPLFSPCDAPVELENVRNQSAFHLISYSFAWISLLSISTFCIRSSLREACSCFLTLSFVGRGLESCTNYALTGIPLEKVTAVRHSKELEIRSDVQGEFTQFILVTSITICLLLWGAKGQKDAQADLANHHDCFSLAISRREHLSLSWKVDL